jgi:hypothetical protein
MKENNVSKAELLERINRSFAALKEAIQPRINQDQQPLGSSAWSIKDHYIHLAAWTQALVEMLTGENGFRLMGIQNAFALEWSEIDKINDQIHHSYSRLSITGAKQFFYDTHCKMVEALEFMPEEELSRLYHVCLPGSDQVKREIPFWQIVLWITCEHYEEHTLFIQSVIQ